MRILTKYGLTNPTIDIVSFAGGKPRIILTADNSFQSPKFSKRYSFFEELFDEFLAKEVKNDLPVKIKELFKESEGVELDKNRDIKREIINYLEVEFEKFLENQSSHIDSSINDVLNTRFPKVVFKKQKYLSLIQLTEEEIEDGFVFFITVSLNTAINRGIENYIYCDSEIQSIIENICYKKKITNSSISVYYYVANEKEIEHSNFTDTNKKALMQGFVQIVLVPTNDYQKAHSKKLVSIHLLQNKDAVNHNKQITRGDD